jgi:hypothetical protein
MIESGPRTTRSSAPRGSPLGAATVVAVLVLLVVAGTACSSSGEQVTTASTSEAPGTTVDPKVADALADAAGKGTTTTTEVAGDAIRAVDFANFTFAPDTCGDDTEREPFVVTGGEASTSSGTNLSVNVDGTAYGDVTDDGIDEAVVLVSCNAGGNASWVIPLVYAVDADGRPERLGILTAEDRDEHAVTAASISDGQIVTDEAVYLPDDPRCCPSATGATIWEWDGTTFVVVSSTEASGSDDGGTPPGPPADPFLITTNSVGLFFLGQTADQLATLGVTVQPVGPRCGTSPYEAVGAPDGVHIVLDDAGSVRAISVSSPAYTTEANATIESFVFDLQSVYPDLEYFDFGPGIGGQYAVISADRSSGIFFGASEDEVNNITVTYGDSGFMDLC